MKKIILFLCLSLFSMIAKSQSITEISKKIVEKYENYKDSTLKDRRFKHSDLQILITQLDSNFKVQNIGFSAEDRAINLISWGKGKKKILLWSQMHGNEPTATAAIFDIFRFLAAQDEFDSLRKKLHSELTLHFIPMLNPDGAEVFERRTRLGIDMNRDASRLQQPESMLLKQIRDTLNPDFGFNLHDQGREHSIGYSDQPATMSFLAPAYNYKKAINESRGNAMKLIAELHQLLSVYIGGNIGRYYDGFEPRAFGDNIQKWGTSTILIESGGRRGDPEKQYIRKMNFLALLHSFQSIASKNYAKFNTLQYNKIPSNGSSLKELKIRKINYLFNKRSYILDLLMDRLEIGYNQDRNFYYQGSVNDVGDLENLYFAYDEYNFAHLLAEDGKTFPQKMTSLEEIRNLNFRELYENGYTSVILETNDLSQIPLFSDFPVNILLNKSEKSNDLKPFSNPDLIFRDRNGKVRAVLINGFVCDLEKDLPSVIKNALLYR